MMRIVLDNEASCRHMGAQPGPVGPADAGMGLGSSANRSVLSSGEADGCEVGSTLGGEIERQDRGSVRRAMLTRAVDIIGSLALLGLTAPVSGLAALALLMAGNRSVIFWQQRVGRGGRPFWFPKFMSMREGAEELHAKMLPHNDHQDSVTFKMRHDPRVTRIGRVIRILSIDELPQLWTVLRGDMSLVGPRPPLPSEVAQYTAAQRRRLEIKPGMTCLWQISGRSLLPFERQVSLDIEYIDKQSIWLDLKILLRTIPAVLSCKGAF